LYGHKYIGYLWRKYVVPHREKRGYSRLEVHGHDVKMKNVESSLHVALVEGAAHVGDYKDNPILHTTFRGNLVHIHGILEENKMLAPIYKKKMCPTFLLPMQAP
jgi:hypothetical protein